MTTSNSTAGLYRGSDVEIARDLAQRDLKDTVYDEGVFWRYIGTQWEKIPDPELKNLVGQYDGAPYGEKGTVRLNANRIRSIIEILSNQLAAPGFFTEAPPGINCENGFLAFDAGRHPIHSPALTRPPPTSPDAW
jgi:hypothetical protein